MSVKLQLYNDLKAVLLTVPEISTKNNITRVDIWNQQALAQSMTKHRPQNFPHVYIEFHKSNYKEPKQKAWNTNIKGEQNYIQNITLHVFTKTLVDETPAFIEKDQLLEDIKYAVKAMQGTNYGPFRLLSDENELDHDALYDSQLVFSTLVQESGIYDTMIDAKIGHEIDITIDNN
jgi:hypothetical protein